MTVSRPGGGQRSWPRWWRSEVWRRFAAIAMLLYSAAAGAQSLSCAATTPVTLGATAERFQAFGPREQVLARGGNRGPSWEWAIGPDTGEDLAVRGSLDWISGRVYGWTASFDTGGRLVLQVRDQGRTVLSLVYPSGMRIGNAIRLALTTDGESGSGVSMRATLSAINGVAVTGAALARAGGGRASKTNARDDAREGGDDEGDDHEDGVPRATSLVVFHPPMRSGFTAEGSVSLVYDRLPTGGKVTMRLQAGNMPCSATNLPPSVTLTAPSAEQVYAAPARIALSASAVDPDGAIARVDFYQGTTLIGSAGAAPYAIEWVQPVAGSYSLAAVATDNQGATKQSDPVRIRVNAPPDVAILSPASGTRFEASADIPIAVQASDADGALQRVELLANGVLIATLTGAPYTYDWSGMAPGIHRLTARAVDSNNAQTESSAIEIDVRPALKLHFVHVDHLNTPRLVADANQKTVWTWEQVEPFGNTPPLDDPDGDSVAFDFPLRFPGQYADRETGLNYNYYRDYDPVTGRYVESDPVGLHGGLNPYSYVDADPTNLIDPYGLAFCWFSISAGRLLCVSDDPGRSDIALDIPVASGNNGQGLICKNNPACTSMANRGPIPPGLWSFGGPGSSGKQNGRRLTPLLGTDARSRTNLASHSCLNPFGPSKTAPFCSEGCVTGTVTDIRAMNRLLNAEPGSVLLVTN